MHVLNDIVKITEMWSEQAVSIQLKIKYLRGKYFKNSDF